MVQRIGGIQDVTVVGISVMPEATEVTLSYKIPYTTLGFTKECDFWANFLEAGGAFGEGLTKLKDLLQRNAPFLETVIRDELGPDAELKWQWLNVPDEDTRFYAAEKCTPDLLRFVTVLEAKEKC